MNLKQKSTDELRKLLDDYISGDTKIKDFFELKYEYDSRFPMVHFTVEGKTGNSILDEYLSVGEKDNVPGHIFQIVDGVITHVDVDEMMWARGSDYFGRSGYVPVENIKISEVD